MVEIGPFRPRRRGEPDADPFTESRSSGAGALSLGVCRSIVNNHGGGMRFTTRTGMACFEVDFPVTAARGEASSDSNSSGKPERGAHHYADGSRSPGPQRQLLGLLSHRGHRVVPVSLEEAGRWRRQRLRFDARCCGPCASPAPHRRGEVERVSERTRASIATFVLISDGYDAELARSIEESGSFLLWPPGIKESELDRIPSAKIVRR